MKGLSAKEIEIRTASIYCHVLMILLCDLGIVKSWDVRWADYIVRVKKL